MTKLVSQFYGAPITIFNLRQFLFMFAVGLDQQFQKGHRRCDGRVVSPLNQIEQGGAPGTVSGMIFKKIDEDVGIEADPFTRGGETLGGTIRYHDWRSRLI